MQAQVDTFDHLYNTERPHQGLPGRITPETAWEATAKAEPPRPKAEEPLFVETVIKRLQPAPVPTDLPAGTHVRKLASNGSFMLARVTYMVGGQHGFKQVLVATNGDNITVIDLHGEILIEHTRPAPGVTYVGNGKNPGPRPNSSQTSPKS